MYKMKIRVVGMLLIITFVFALGLSAKAVEYPTKPITLNIPYGAGGPTDMLGRALANTAQKYLGQSIICENTPGGGGTVGPSLVVKKSADGYTIGMTSTSALDINWYMREMSFHPLDDIEHIIRISGYLNGIVVRADSPWRNIQDLIQYAKQNPEKVSYGSSGSGSPPHLVMEELASLAGGIRFIHIPYKGSADSTTALLGGHVDALAGSSAWLPLVDAGKLRLLAVFAPFRPDRYSHVPTLKDIGYDLVFASPLDIIGPKGLPKSIIQKLHDVFKKCMDEPEYQAVLTKLNMGKIYLNSENLEKAHREEFERIEKIVKKLGLQKK